MSLFGDKQAIRGGFIPKLRSELGSIWLELGLGLDLSGLCIAGVVASRAAIKLKADHPLFDRLSNCATSATL